MAPTKQSKLAEKGLTLPPAATTVPFLADEKKAADDIDPGHKHVIRVKPVGGDIKEFEVLPGSIINMMDDGKPEVIQTTTPNMIAVIAKEGDIGITIAKETAMMPSSSTSPLLDCSTCRRLHIEFPSYTAPTVGNTIDYRLFMHEQELRKHEAAQKGRDYIPMPPSDGKCGICFEKSTDLCQSFLCNHRYCRGCLSNFRDFNMARQCPGCRAKTIDEDEELFEWYDELRAEQSDTHHKKTMVDKAFTAWKATMQPSVPESFISLSHTFTFYFGE